MMGIGCHTPSSDFNVEVKAMRSGKGFGGNDHRPGPFGNDKSSSINGKWTGCPRRRLRVLAG